MGREEKQSDRRARRTGRRKKHISLRSLVRGFATQLQRRIGRSVNVSSRSFSFFFFFWCVCGFAFRFSFSFLKQTKEREPLHSSTLEEGRSTSFDVKVYLGVKVFVPQYSFTSNLHFKGSQEE